MITSIKFKDKINLSKFKFLSPNLRIEENINYDIDELLKEEYCYILEYTKEVSYYYYQPIKIDVRDETLYIPDFYVEFWDGIKYFVDFDIGKQIDSAVVEFMSHNNIIHRFLREENVINDLLYNSKFLLLYKTPKFGFNPTDVMIIQDLFIEHTELTIQEIRDNAVLDKSKRGEILYIVWYMIANYHLIIDLDKPLSMNTRVRIN